MNLGLGLLPLESALLRFWIEAGTEPLPSLAAQRKRLPPLLLRYEAA